VTAVTTAGDGTSAVTTAVSAPEPDAERVAALTLRSAGVAALWPGTFGEIATYLPGRRVLGVRVGPGSVEIHLVAHYRVDGRDVSLVELAAAVRRTVIAATAAQVVDVYIDDVLDAEASEGTGQR
jgi:hypothetical protein